MAAVAKFSIFATDSIIRIMELIYQVSEAELDYKLFEAIKVAFKGQKLRISVRVETSSEATSFEKKILKNASSEISYVFENDEFDKYVAKSESGEKVDAEQFKRVGP